MSIMPVLKNFAAAFLLQIVQHSRHHIEMKVLILVNLLKTSVIVRDQSIFNRVIRSIVKIVILRKH